MQINNVQTGSTVGTIPANVGDRLIAFIIDAFILTAYSICISTLFFSFDVGDEMLWIVFLFVPLLFYPFLFELILKGQTPGKRAVGISVVDVQGTPPSAGQLLVRWAFIICGFYFISGVIAFIVIIANGKGQRLGDLVAGTMVVKTAKRVTTSFYSPTYPMVTRLTPEDIELITRALRANTEFENPTPLHLVSEKMKLLLDIDTQLQPSDFLSTIIRDYRSVTKR